MTDLRASELQQELLELRRRVKKRIALLRLVLALLRSSGLTLTDARLPVRVFRCERSCGSCDCQSVQCSGSRRARSVDMPQRVRRTTMRSPASITTSAIASDRSPVAIGEPLDFGKSVFGAKWTLIVVGEKS